MPSICAECKRQKGISCCEVWTGDVPTMPLSLPEVKRIQKATGMSPSDFMVLEEVDPWDASAATILSPVFKSLHVNDQRLRLRTIPVDDRKGIEKCVFLGDEGCKLAKSDRPHGCRLYPFTFNHSLAKSETGGLVRFPTGETCLAAEAAPTDDARLCASLGTTQNELIRLGTKREEDAKIHQRLMTKE